jgi:hypothetical protein
VSSAGWGAAWSAAIGTASSPSRLIELKLFCIVRVLGAGGLVPTGRLQLAKLPRAGHGRWKTRRKGTVTGEPSGLVGMSSAM